MVTFDYFLFNSYLTTNFQLGLQIDLYFSTSTCIVNDSETEMREKEREILILKETIPHKNTVKSATFSLSVEIRLTL